MNKFCDLSGSTISKLKEINYDLLTAEEYEWLYFFLRSRIFSNFLIIILSRARKFIIRKTIKMCKKGRFLYKSQSLSYPFIAHFSPGSRSLNWFVIMKIIYVNCGVKNYMKVDHHSYRRNFCSCEKKAWKKKTPSQVYNEPILQPAPSWLVSLIGKSAAPVSLRSRVWIP